jgi:DMSO/TMAO reductase YedYZ molybdopterin-dependent catalytic subunit
MISRRSVIRGVGAAAVMGAPIVHARLAPAGFVPVLAAGPAIAGKEGLSIVADRPLNLETPPHLLDDDVTPASRFFVRNNGMEPEVGAAAAADWRLKIDGEVERPLDLSIADLKRKFEIVTLRLALECAGNGRKFHRPAVAGQQWTFGAVGFGDWTGVRLSDVLKAAGLSGAAVYTGHYGADRHLNGGDEPPISRGIPIAKALEPHTLIAFGLNRADLPPLNGHPLRLVVPGWPGSCSQKWLTRILIRDREHDGAKMTGSDYRLPAYPVAPGAEVPDQDMRVIESMPVKSLITFPATGAEVKAGAAFETRGHAWSGESEVAGVDLSIDFGASWVAADLPPAKNKYAPRRFRASFVPPVKGYYEVWARARDAAGRMQPASTPGWNPKGYNNNMQHRVAVFAA